MLIVMGFLFITKYVCMYKHAKIYPYVNTKFCVTDKYTLKLLSLRFKLSIELYNTENYSKAQSV